MRPLKFADFTESDLDATGVKKTVQPDGFQRLIMEQLTQVSGIEISQDRRLVLQVQTSARLNGNFRGGFTPAHPCSPYDADGVTLNYDADAELWWAVLFHELGHATGTKERLNRECAVGTRSWNDDALIHSEEVIAESVARNVLRILGLSTNSTEEEHKRYIRHHSFNAFLAADVDTPVLDLATEIEDATSMVLSWVEQTSLANRLNDTKNNKAAA